MLSRAQNRAGAGTLISVVALVVVVLCLLGLLFMGVWHLVEAGAQRSWKSVPCQIISSRIDETVGNKGNRQFKLSVRYSYEFNGQKFKGDRLRPTVRFMGGDGGTTSWKAIEEESKQFAAGKSVHCYVNPRNPSEAALYRTSFVPGIVCVTAPVFLFFLLGLRVPRMFKKSAARQPLSATPNPKLHEARQMAFWGTLLAVMGGFCSYYLFLSPLLKSRVAKTWPEVACVILENRVRETSTRHGSEYKPDVFYEFEFEGRKHRSNQSHFENAEPDKLSDTTRFLDNYPVNSKSVCYVNPDNPAESVLDRSFPLMTSFYPLIGFCMFGGGLFGALWGFWTICGKKPGVVAPAIKGQATPWGATVNPNAVKLRPLEASTALLLASFVGLLVAGGIIAWRVLRFWHNWRELGVIEFSLLEILILVFVGAGAGWLALRCWRYFDPHPNLTLDRGSVALGDAFELQWTFSGPVGRLRTLQISLEGREEAMVQQEVRGEYGVKHKSERKEQDVFYRETLSTPQSAAERLRGGICVSLPRGQMPTFNGQKTKIIWTLLFEGDIAWSPKMKHEFPLQVLAEGAHV